MSNWILKSSLVCLLMLFFRIADTSAQEVTYKDVAPIFQSRCVICHTGPGASYDLQLDSLDALLKGSKNGVVVKPGNPQESELILRIKGVSQPRMPLTGPPFLSDDETGLIEKWIETGLKSASDANKAPETTAASAYPGAR
jgi:mono/diheme cytochrome c family protein